MTKWNFGCLFSLWRFSVSLRLILLNLMLWVGFVCVVTCGIGISQGLTVFQFSCSS